MARIRRHLLILALLALSLTAVPTHADGLYTTPVLRLDPGMHMAMITRADVDSSGTFVVTGSEDKTVRVWSAQTGKLLKTIPLPAGPGNIGKVYSVAISPDGTLIAAGGWTRWTAADREENIYIFERATGKLLTRLEDLPSNVLYLAFSPDGGRLVACLGANGIRLYENSGSWREISADADYGSSSYGAAFAPDGRFATTSYDGHLRLYTSDGQILEKSEAGHSRHYGIAFHPDGQKIAVGYYDAAAVDIYSTQSLTHLSSPDTSGIDNGNLATVAWSLDGNRLFAAGDYQVAGERPVLVWSESGRGPRTALPGGLDVTMSLRPLSGDGLLVASGDPRLTLLDKDGNQRWTAQPVKADFRGQSRELLLSKDGTRVAFGYEVFGVDPAMFDGGRLSLTFGPGEDLAAPDQSSLPVSNWFDRINPALGDTVLPLETYERSRSLAIRPDGAGFVLGADWSLRAYDAAGEELWNRAVPGAVWAVNISGDGRYIVAAYDDGTIRWHRPEDGAELLAFFPFADRRNWVAWEPDGRFASTPGARGALRWHVNRGWDETPLRLPAHQIPKSNRPEVIRRILTEGGTMEAVYAAEQIERKQALKRLVGDAILPGARLHMLNIGVSAYGDGARALALDWADEDAADLFAALRGQTEGWPYEPGFAMTLRDQEATGERILHQLANIRGRMKAQPHRDNLAVISFSGHGTVLGEGAEREFFLLPHDFRMTSEAAKRRSGLSATELRAAIGEIARHGRVLLLLDACRSGAVSGNAGFAHDNRLLISSLASRNVSVLTSSSGEESSVELAAIRNGAFTEVVLEALGRGGDANGDGMVSLSEFVGHVTAQVLALTGGSQRPTVEMRFEGNLFAASN